MADFGDSFLYEIYRFVTALQLPITGKRGASSGIGHCKSMIIDGTPT